MLAQLALTQLDCIQLICGKKGAITVRINTTFFPLVAYIFSNSTCDSSWRLSIVAIFHFYLGIKVRPLSDTYWPTWEPAVFYVRCCNNMLQNALLMCKHFCVL